MGGVSSRSALRIEQSRQELEQLRRDFRAWLAHRRQTDPHKRYSTQLAALEAVFEAVVNGIGQGLDSVDVGASVDGAYEKCRAVDRQLVFAWRLWEYYREKWDQRDDRLLADVLEAAEEIIWSCYRSPFDLLGLPAGPTPLPYVVSDFSAHAVASAHLPKSLRTDDELLRQVLSELPVPIVGLPRICVSRPWWLIVLAHEVGHHVAYALDDGALAAVLLGSVTQAAQRSTADPAVQEAWRGCAHEAFADAYAVAMVGAAHLWVLDELLCGSEQSPLRTPPGYPPPAVRRALAAGVLAELGVEGGQGVPEAAPLPDAPPSSLDSADRTRLSTWMESVPAVASVLADGVLLRDARLSDLTGFAPGDLSREGGADWWRQQLAAENEPSPEATSDAARLAVAGAVGAWVDLAVESSAEERAPRMETLRRRVLDVLPECREPGRRAPATVAEADVEELARRLAHEVREIPAEAA